MVNQFFLFLLSLSVSGTLTGLLVLLLRPLTRKFFSGKWNYYIWGIVLLRLTLPVHFEANLTNSFFTGVETIRTVWQEEASPDTERPLPAAAGKESPSAGADAGTAPAYSSAASGGKALLSGKDALLYGEGDGDRTQAPAADSSAVSSPALSYLWTVWLFVALLMLLLKINDYRNFVAYMRAGAAELTDPQALRLLEINKLKLGIGKKVRIYVSPLAVSPAIMGLRKPFILLPAGGLDPEHLSYILLHELVHLKRKDLWCKWLFQLVICIHWFNPFLRLFHSKFNQDCELSCDEKVLSLLDKEQHKTYGNVLLDAAGIQLNYKNNVFQTTLLEDKKNMKERLKGIIHYKKNTPVILLISLSALAAVGILSIFAGVWTAGTDTAFTPGAFSDEYGPDNVSDDGYGSGFTGMFAKFGDKIADSLSNLWILDTHISSGDMDDFLSSGQTDVHGAAYQTYDDDAKIAGGDNTDRWQAYIYSSNKSHGVDCQGFALNGASSQIIYYTNKDTQLQVRSSYKLIGGRFKLVVVGPDNKVELINETGDDTSPIITLKKGRNAIKMVGQDARLEVLKIDYSGLNKEDLDAVCFSENEEYACLMMKQLESGAYAYIDTEELLDGIVSMDNKTVSLLFEQILKAKIPLTGQELADFLIYSDRNMSSGYLEEALESGTVHLTAGDVEDLMPYLEDSARTSLLLTLDRESFTFEVLKNSMPYLNDNGREQGILYYLELGNNLSYKQFDDLSPYLSDALVDKIDVIPSE